MGRHNAGNFDHGGHTTQKKGVQFKQTRRSEPGMLNTYVTGYHESWPRESISFSGLTWLRRATTNWFHSSLTAEMEECRWLQ